MSYRICEVSESEKESLAQLRVSAMRDSLVAVGRFDPDRARSRFIEGFDVAATRKIEVAGEMAGFYVLKDRGSHLCLEHLYIEPSYQGKGLGSSVLASLLDQARVQCLPVRLGALRNSRSNQFYVANGFVQTHEEEWDIYYEFRHG
ncbi:GNAT family N-acetyltransferase [Allohahella sp. A8]|uniref:GNAT family N-acetyltransferase n=1 Tax=Allohahella sp. A8 TaxID=3141461 RepID=UPI003A808A88